jgi:hypothetical protein
MNVVLDMNGKVSPRLVYQLIILFIIKFQLFVLDITQYQAGIYFKIISRYRKIVGDICEGGVTHPDIKLRCPSRL